MGGADSQNNPNWRTTKGGETAPVQDIVICQSINSWQMKERLLEQKCSTESLEQFMYSIYKLN